MINPQWLELPMSRTNFHGPKDVRAIEVRLYLVYFFQQTCIFSFTFYRIFAVCGLVYNNKITHSDNCRHCDSSTHYFTHFLRFQHIYDLLINLKILIFALNKTTNVSSLIHLKHRWPCIALSSKQFSSRNLIRNFAVYFDKARRCIQLHFEIQRHHSPCAEVGIR